MQTAFDANECHFAILRERGCRITPIVTTILSLLSHSRMVRTILQMRNEASRALGFKIGIPTMYRICERLHQAGVLRCMHCTDGVMRYYICENPKNEKHVHFICTNCMKVQEVDFCVEEKIIKHVTTELDVEVQNQFIQIEGLCETCKS